MGGRQRERNGNGELSPKKSLKGKILFYVYFQWSSRHSRHFLNMKVQWILNSANGDPSGRMKSNKYGDG